MKGPPVLAGDRGRVSFWMVDRMSVPRICAGVTNALLAVMLLVSLLLVLSPSARAEESPSPSPSPSVVVSPSPSPSPTPGPSETASPPASTEQVVTLDPQQFEWLQIGIGLLVFTSFVGMVVAWAR